MCVVRNAIPIFTKTGGGRREGKKKRRMESNKLWLTRKFLKYIYLTKDSYLECRKIDRTSTEGQRTGTPRQRTQE